MLLEHGADGVIYHSLQRIDGGRQGERGKQQGAEGQQWQGSGLFHGKNLSMFRSCQPNRPTCAEHEPG